MTIWPTTQLERLCEVTSSKRIYASELTPAGVPFYRSKEIIERLSGRDVVSTPLFISEARFQEILRTSGAPRAGDLLLTSRGTLGVPYVVQVSDRFHFADGNLTWFRNFRGIEGIFLKYFFLSPGGKAELLKCVIGSSQAAYTIVSLKKIEVPLPPPATQKRIVAILSSYDDLIENNTRRIAILEEMARRIYEEWFVRFRFPGHEGVRMVESELRLLPEGWASGPLGELVDFQKGKKPVAVYADRAPGRVPALLIDTLRGGNVEFADADHLVSVTRSDTIMVMDGSGSAQVFIGHEGVIGSTLGRYRVAANAPVGAFWLFLFFLTNQSDIAGKNVGAAIPHANKDYIRSMPVSAPPGQIASQFEDAVEPMFDLIRTLKAKNSTLRATRDLLLPKLVSGKLDVSAMPEPEALAA